MKEPLPECHPSCLMSYKCIGDHARADKRSRTCQRRCRGGRCSEACCLTYSYDTMAASHVAVSNPIYFYLPRLFSLHGRDGGVVCLCVEGWSSGGGYFDRYLQAGAGNVLERYILSLSTIATRLTFAKCEGGTAGVQGGGGGGGGCNAI